MHVFLCDSLQLDAGLVMLQGAFDHHPSTTAGYMVAASKRAGAWHDETLGDALTGWRAVEQEQDSKPDVLESRQEWWEGRMLANFHPTYYGMAVARFDRRVSSAEDVAGEGTEAWRSGERADPARKWKAREPLGSGKGEEETGSKMIPAVVV